MFIVLIVLISYLVAGALYARKRYANMLTASKARALVNKDSAVIAKTLKEESARYNEMRNSTQSLTLAKYHTRDCDKYMYPNIGVCDCGAAQKSHQKVVKLQQDVEGGYDVPDTVKPMFFWPGYMVQNFIKSEGIGGVTKAERQRLDEIKTAQHNAEMAELRAREAAALDAELKALDLPSSV